VFQLSIVNSISRPILKSTSQVVLNMSHHIDFSPNPAATDCAIDGKGLSSKNRQKTGNWPVAESNSV
jgi:hypothetical protein